MIRDQHVITAIGERFGQQIADAIGGANARTVTINSIDKDKNVAMCVVFEGDEPLPVPLMLLGVEDATFKITPTVDTTAVIGMLNGDKNRPYFISYSQIDEFEFTRSKTSLIWKVDPEDEEKDTVSFAIDKSTVDVSKDEIKIANAESSVRLDKDVIEFNGGELGSLVVIGKLTERLNKMQSEIDKIQSAINSHTHTVSTAGGPTAQTGNTTGITYAKVQLTQVQDGDYENKKITQ